MIYKSLKDKNLVDALNNNEVGLLPTDTIYGLSCSAYSKDSVERVYDIKGKDKGIPVIVLISAVSDLEKFQLHLDRDTKQLLANNWPGRTSIILPLSRGFEFLTHGAKGLAFRMPDNANLLKLLASTGPLISTSANPSGLAPAKNVTEAKNYFGDQLDFYVDAGDLISEPSTLVDLTGKKPVILRQGATAFKNVV